MVASQMRDQFNGLAALTAAQESTIAGQATQIAALEAAIPQTARNPSSVGPFSISMSDPPTRDQVQAILDVLNQLITALVRT